jgi:hypothetical protein
VAVTGLNLSAPKEGVGRLVVNQAQEFGQLFSIEEIRTSIAASLYDPARISTFGILNSYHRKEAGIRWSEILLPLNC